MNKYSKHLHSQIVNTECRNFDRMFTCFKWHMSHVTCHVSHVFFLVFFYNNNEPSRLRVCYQCGLNLKPWYLWTIDINSFIPMTPIYVSKIFSLGSPPLSLYHAQGFQPGLGNPVAWRALVSY